MSKAAAGIDGIWNEILSSVMLGFFAWLKLICRQTSRFRNNNILYTKAILKCCPFNQLSIFDNNNGILLNFGHLHSGVYFFSKYNLKF